MIMNTPVVKIAVVGVSRSCFPIELTRNRLARVVEACEAQGIGVCACRTIIGNERDVRAALAEAASLGANAAVIYLGNFGPEGPLSIFAREFGGPVMACAAAEESGSSLVDGRGDALCGMLNASYNFGLRNVRVYIPESPVGLPEDVAGMIGHFAKVAGVLVGLRRLKVFAFGPRPEDFFACNAPIKPLYDLGIEVMENSELDLLARFRAVDEGDPAVAEIAREMAEELGAGNAYPDLLPRLARFELALMRFYEENLGSREFGVFANKCWPAFEEAFGFVPCYVNSRLTAKGIPAACEVDIYGAVSEFMCGLASGLPVTLLDINDTVPAAMYAEDIRGKYNYRQAETFLGFHCGNTCSRKLKNPHMGYQLIMKRELEPELAEPNITRGTMEGDIIVGDITFYRLQSTAGGQLKAYAAEGEVLDVPSRSFGSIGVFAISEMDRFYRHVLLAKQFPHHGAVAFGHHGKALFDLFSYLGIADISYNRPKSMPYPDENPYA
jgi:L-fucose isomerase-like protein